MEDIVVLEWTFALPDYFESSLQITGDSYEMVIEAGKVEAHIPPEVYASTTDMRDQLHNVLNDHAECRCSHTEKKGVKNCSLKPVRKPLFCLYEMAPLRRSWVAPLG